MVFDSSSVLVSLPSELHASASFTDPADTSISTPSADYQLVEYYAKSCPHCTRMEPVWNMAKHEALSNSNFSNVEFVAKQCYADGWAPGKDLSFCQQNGITAFPTIVLYNKATGQHWTAPTLVDPSTQGKADSLLEFVRNQTSAKTDDTVQQQSVGGIIDLATASVVVTGKGQRENRVILANFL